MRGTRLSGRDIFISYSREDRPAARHFAKCFADEGFVVWWDATLQAGETFDEVIERELKAARAVVVLWSPRPNGSPDHSLTNPGASSTYAQPCEAANAATPVRACSSDRPRRR